MLGILPAMKGAARCELHWFDPEVVARVRDPDRERRGAADAPLKGRTMYPEAQKPNAPKAVAATTIGTPDSVHWSATTWEAATAEAHKKMLESGKAKKVTGEIVGRVLLSPARQARAGPTSRVRHQAHQERPADRHASTTTDKLYILFAEEHHPRRDGRTDLQTVFLPLLAKTVDRERHGDRGRRVPRAVRARGGHRRDEGGGGGDEVAARLQRAGRAGSSGFLGDRRRSRLEAQAVAELAPEQQEADHHLERDCRHRQVPDPGQRGSPRRARAGTPASATTRTSRDRGEQRRHAVPHRLEHARGARRSRPRRRSSTTRCAGTRRPTAITCGSLEKTPDQRRRARCGTARRQHHHRDAARITRGRGTWRARAAAAARAEVLAGDRRDREPERHHRHEASPARSACRCRSRPARRRRTARLTA